MKQINTTQLYNFIIKNLDKFEIATPDPTRTVTYIAFDFITKEKTHKEVFVYHPSVATLLLECLYRNWDKIITIEQLEWWFTLSISTKNQRYKQSRYKYEELIKKLKKMEVK